MEETLQHQETAQCSGLPPTGPGNHRSDVPKAGHALTFKLDQSIGADHYDVAQALGDGAGIRSGFTVVLPKALFVNGGGKGDAAIRLFALTQAGAAAELPFEQSQ